MTARKDPEMVQTPYGWRQGPGASSQAAPSLHEEVCSGARRLAHEIHSDIFAGEKEIAAAIEAGFRFREQRLREERAEMLARAKNRIDSRLNDYLCDMKPDYDDSITGFNEAWDIVRKIMAEEIARAEGRQS